MMDWDSIYKSMVVYVPGSKKTTTSYYSPTTGGTKTVDTSTGADVPATVAGPVPGATVAPEPAPVIEEVAPEPIIPDVVTAEVVPTPVKPSTITSAIQEKKKAVSGQVKQREKVSKSGEASTILTGNISGVDPLSLLLGKKTLLGG